MKKYLSINGEIFESTLIARRKALEDSMLNSNRRSPNSTSTSKRNLYLDKELTNGLEEYFPEIYNDFKIKQNNNEPTVKVYFSVLNFIENNNLVNEKKQSLSEQIDPTTELLEKLRTLSANKSNFFIECLISNAGNHGVSLKKWKVNKEILYDVLFSDTLFNLYVFKINGDSAVFCEIIQEDIDKKPLVSTGSILNDNKPENTIFFGSPGTGKSHKINEKLKDLEKKYYERITFHPEYDHASFVGGYKPISEKNDAGIDEVKYKFVPQVFTNIYERAWKDSDNQYYLAIEEINRGNCAEIFGDIFQLLDRNSNYTVTPSSELKQHLEEKLGADHEGIVNGLKLPNNLTIWATMNTSDQSLFPMDSAFKRRWNWEYIPICYDEGEANESSKYIVEIGEGITFSWLKFIEAVNTKIKHNPNLGMDKCIGNYFIKPEDDKIELKEFINKAIFYLWNDVFKDEDERDSIFKKDNFYEDFFPIETKGKDLVLEILKSDDFSSVEITEAE